MTKTQSRKDKKRKAKMRKVRVFMFVMLTSFYAFAQRSSVNMIIVSSSEVIPDSVFASMGLMVQAGSPCIGAGTPIPGVTTDFFGLPVDPVHPTIGAVEYHEATPDYIELVRQICIQRYWKATSEREATIAMLFQQVYGYSGPN